MTANNSIRSALLTLRPTAWALIATSVFLFLVYGYTRILPKPIPRIPYNEDIGIFGDLPALLKAMKSGSIRPWLWAMPKKHNSPITQVFLSPFSKPFVILSDYYESYDVLVHRTGEFDRASLHIDEFLPFMPDHQAAMMSSDPRLKANKELVKGLMSPGILSSDVVPVIYEKARHLIGLWKTKMDAAQGRPFAALEDLRELSWELTLTFTFGFDEGRGILERHREYLSSKGPSASWTDAANTVCFARPPLPSEAYALAVMTKFMQFTTSSFAPHLQVWILKRTKWRKYFQTRDRLLSDEINKSVERLFAAGSDSARRKTVVDHLLERELAMAEKSGSRPNFHKPSIRDEAFGYFVAGSDTVSTSMSWAVKFLADNQTAQAKLRRQLHSSYRDAYDEKRQPDVSEVVHTSAPYLDAFIVESLRCGKTVPSLVRQATVDTEILGYHIPKGTQIFLGVGPSITEPAMPVADEARSPSSRAYSQRLPSWDDDEITYFKPERWLKTRGDKTRTGAGEFDNLEYDCNAGPMLSFGAGSRGCFGKRLAYLEKRIMISLLVWNFTFEKCAPELSDYVERDEFTCVPTCCYVKLQRTE
ncbi:hypothetical protein E4U60_000602 [Claviceps pazoutovae]|uniref:Cytochrome P450 monooxygenase n=1 Tax=Claviceps pazoutovae TaxID=1649127 RepID=A0A9P7ME85_9HYPO|nr:hypothetical protein E4U60_000602 [Claviceps pazoutovae]